MQIAYIFCYTLAYLPYLYNVGVSIEKKPAPSDHEFKLKFCRLKVRDTPYFVSEEKFNYIIFILTKYIQ